MPVIRFGRYELDPVQGLTEGTREVRLTPKSLSVLQALVERAGRVVTKDALLRAVWGDVAVTDAALTSCIQEVRHALDDDARHPRFIETLHRRGYRFIAPTAAEVGALGTGPRSHPDAPLVGRRAAVAAIMRAFAAAERGVRQVCFVTGEPGIGKTRVVKECLAFLPGSTRMAAGQCVEQYGAGEPYQPLLDALTRLCRLPGGAQSLAALKRYAPSWLAQLPGMLPAEEQASLARSAVGTSRTRMMRELSNAVEAMTVDAPLVLWLEDLHWSDTSTLDWILAFAHRPEPARLLLLGTLRPAGGSADRPLATFIDAVRAGGHCSEIALQPLDLEAMLEYLSIRFPPAAEQTPALAALAVRLHRHTGGNPLFVVNVAADLVARGLLVPHANHWLVTATADAADLGIPDDIGRMVRRQLDGLSADERALLEVASVAGAAFATPLAAAAADLSPWVAEGRLAGLARQGRFVEEAGVAEWPDGTVTSRFAFTHAVYQEVLYRTVPAARRIRLHRAIALAAERAYGARAPEIAAELAMHFDCGRDPARAVSYLQHAAENARRRSAFAESRMHFERALALLETQTASPERVEREINLRIGLGATLMVTHGFGAAGAEEAYTRARDLCRTLGETPRLFPAVWGLWLFYWGRGAVGTAGVLCRELLALADRSADDALRLQAQHATWATAFSEGQFERVVAAAREGIRLYDAARHGSMAATYGSHDAGVCAHMFCGRALALCGRADEAVAMSDRAVALARSLRHPFSLALALTFRAAVAQSHRDSAGAAAHARAAAALSREQEFRLTHAWCSTLEGWAHSQEGRQEGVSAMVTGIDAARTSGSDQFLPYLLGMLADACLGSGRVDEAAAALQQAQATVERTDERFYQAELHRLQGELLCRSGTPSDRAERSFLAALDVARRQGAALLALRAAVSLARLWLGLGRAADACTLLGEARDAVHARLELADVADADSLLGGCSPDPPAGHGGAPRGGAQVRRRSR